MADDTRNRDGRSPDGTEIASRGQPGSTPTNAGKRGAAGAGGGNGKAPGNPFSGLSIDFSGDRTGGVPGLPMPEAFSLRMVGTAPGASAVVSTGGPTSSSVAP